MSSEPSSLKVLCLHGYKQNEVIFREKTGSLRKILKKHCQFFYITAPNSIPLDGIEENLTGWWFSKQDKSYIAQDITDCSCGFESSLDVVAQALAEHGPFDGVLGFSQGASLLSVICSLKEKGDKRFQDFTFAIFFAGFKSKQTSHQVFYDQPLHLPSLHIIGDTDKVIEKEMSDELLEVFTNKTVVRHPGGHFVPTSASQKKEYIEFLNSFVKKQF